jgi:hypothetical protein
MISLRGLLILPDLMKYICGDLAPRVGSIFTQPKLLGSLTKKYPQHPIFHHQHITQWALHLAAHVQVLQPLLFLSRLVQAAPPVDVSVLLPLMLLSRLPLGLF